MFRFDLSPVAPAAILLLSAFILFILPKVRLPWRYTVWPNYFLAPGLVGVAMGSLLLIQLSGGASGTGHLGVPAGWPLSMDAATLHFQADGFSLAVLILTLILVLVVALDSSPFFVSSESDQPQIEKSNPAKWHTTAGWLLVGAALCLGAVSANLVTLSVAVMVGDLLFMGYWLKRKHKELALARLFLGLISASAIALNGALLFSETTTTVTNSSGLWLLGLVLWLRLGLIPFIELAEQKDDEGHRVYLAFPMVLGFILIGRVLDHPLPGGLLWLTAVMMLLSGGLAWLTDRLPLQLSYLIVTEILLLLLTSPLTSEIIAVAGLMLLLSLTVLSLTPRLGRSYYSGSAWLWPYLLATLASLTLLGLPFFIGWPVRLTVYEKLLSLDSLGLILVAILAEMLALSSLVHFWRESGIDQNNPRQRLTIVLFVLVPFLLPGLGLLGLEKIARLSLPTSEIGSGGVGLALMTVIVIGAAALHIYRKDLLTYLKMSPTRLTELGQLQWLWPRGAGWLQRLGQLFLRVDVIFEGQHYLGWAIFATIIGALIILLRV